MTTYVPVEPEPYRTTPDAWQTQLWARLLRRVGRHWVISRHVRDYCLPLVVEGREALRGLGGPAVVIANHTSHFDTIVALAVLPERIRARTAVAAAADRFYRLSRRGWWYSLFYNTFPIERRGGGSASLDYPQGLLKRGWSVLIYPEGTRSTSGDLGAFHHGVALLAMRGRVPVVPIFTDGLANVMPKGQRSPRPAAVHVRIGAPVWLEDAATVPEGTARLEEAMQRLAEAAREESRRPAAALGLAGATR